jgi:hypothetical protein
MGELKSCLFCGKNVDQAFEYCPHCGYEFGEGEDKSTSGGDKSTFGGDHPGLVEEAAGEIAPAVDRDYLHRLRTLQEILTDMERELDLIIAMDAKHAEGVLRTSSKGP